MDFLVVVDLGVDEEDPVVQVLMAGRYCHLVGGGGGQDGRDVLLVVEPPLEVVGVDGRGDGRVLSPGPPPPNQRVSLRALYELRCARLDFEIFGWRKDSSTTRKGGRSCSLKAVPNISTTTKTLPFLAVCEVTHLLEVCEEPRVVAAAQPA